MLETIHSTIGAARDLINIDNFMDDLIKLSLFRTSAALSRINKIPLNSKGL